MESLNLIYLRRYQALVYRDCGFALTPKSYEGHLRKLHKFKGEPLHVALLEVQQVELQGPSTMSLLDSYQPPL